MRTSYAPIIGGAIAVVLLLLYISFIIVLIRAVVICGERGFANASRCDANSNVTDNILLISILTTVGGLVSALVISELAATRPGANPTDRYITSKTPPGIRKAVNIVAALYLSSWIIVGLSAIIVGVVYPGINRTITDVGTTWLGLAVASAYSYFGIRPQNP